MAYFIEAAGISNTGRVRKNNEDNFYFCGQYLPEENDGGKTSVLHQELKDDLYFAVYDGMGGENFGEAASFAAANKTEELFRWGVPVLTAKYLESLARQLNDAVVHAAKLHMTDRMGSTMVAVSFSQGKATVCNLGDSRAYCLRNGELIQISRDHVSSRPLRPGGKAPLTQHLGIDPEVMLVEPYVAEAEYRAGDIYLVCSDGITDMLTDEEIKDILSQGGNADDLVNQLVQAALDHGGKDNTTAIVCRVEGFAAAAPLPVKQGKAAGKKGIPVIAAVSFIAGAILMLVIMLLINGCNAQKQQPVEMPVQTQAPESTPEPVDEEPVDEEEPTDEQAGDETDVADQQQEEKTEGEDAQPDDPAVAAGQKEAEQESTAGDDTAATETAGQEDSAQKGTEDKSTLLPGGSGVEAGTKK